MQFTFNLICPIKDNGSLNLIKITYKIICFITQYFRHVLHIINYKLIIQCIEFTEMIRWSWYYYKSFGGARDRFVTAWAGASKVTYSWHSVLWPTLAHVCALSRVGGCTLTRVCTLTCVCVPSHTYVCILSRVCVCNLKGDCALSRVCVHNLTCICTLTCMYLQLYVEKHSIVETQHINVNISLDRFYFISCPIQLHIYNKKRIYLIIDFNIFQKNSNLSYIFLINRIK